MKLTLLYSLLLLPFFVPAQNETGTAVYFDFNKHQLTPSAKATLDSFINIAAGQTAIELRGYCDGIGNNAYNDRLSVQRVQAVKKYLLQNKLPLAAFTISRGYGKRKPVNGNSTATERQANRRVDIAASLNTVTDNVSTQLQDTAVKAGSNIILQNINFIGARHQLLPESYPVLKDLLGALKKNKNLVIQIQGHICCLPGNVDGLDEETGLNNLSEARAKAIWEYLIKNGIAATRLSYIGVGHNQPLFDYPEKNETEAKLNRRVEIKIISK
ncbi:OmpA family protein [Ferruginibacter profundus]